eukprot:11747539-Alexandrium_andersonii.AAC.1
MAWPRGFASMLRGDDLKEYEKLHIDFKRDQKRWHATPSVANCARVNDAVNKGVAFLQRCGFDTEATAAANRKRMEATACVSSAAEKNKKIRAHAAALVELSTAQASDLDGAEQALAAAP